MPAVAVNIAGISRDPNRVFNKINGFNVPYNLSETPSEILKKIPQPVPVNITVNMTIVTKYQSDMDQIITNFIPYCDPYIIISWKLPGLRPSQVPFEIRSEILWSGNINVSYPTELQGTQPFRVSADTSFTIKGWLFKKMDETVKKIYTIQSDYLLSDNPTTDGNLLTYLN